LKLILEIFLGERSMILLKVLVSEILLQKTKAENVVPVYNKFIKNIPVYNRYMLLPIMILKMI